MVLPAVRMVVCARARVCDCVYVCVFVSGMAGNKWLMISWTPSPLGPFGDLTVGPCLGDAQQPESRGSHPSRVRAPRPSPARAGGAPLSRMFPQPLDDLGAYLAPRETESDRESGAQRARSQ